jgi:NADPH:quinone reductase-like Zn-dependent oxidoreductase
MKYRSVVATTRGGPEVLKVVENELRAPDRRDVRIRVLAVPVSGPDIEGRYGRTPFNPQYPYVPGYAVVGDVDAIGEDVTEVVGDRAAAITAYGGYTEYLYWQSDHLMPVPITLDAAEVAPLMLNYLVAYQILHRTVKVKAGDKALIIGASGGIGTAFLQLGKLAGLIMYGLASSSKHPILTEYEAVPIDYHTQNFAEVIRAAEPDGLDYVFNGMGGDYLKHRSSVLRRGGIWVGYGNPLSFSRMLQLLGQLILFGVLPNARPFKYYGAGKFRFNLRPFREDWAALFKLLEEGKIKPVIARKFPILEAAKANELLESGAVVGTVVLVTPELLMRSQSV